MDWVPFFITVGDGNTRTLQGVRDSIWGGEDLTVATCPLGSAGVRGRARGVAISCSLTLQPPFHLGCSVLGKKAQAGAGSVGETAAVHMRASIGLPQTPGTEVPHAIWDAPLALSAAIYAQVMGVKQFNSLRVQKVAEVCELDQVPYCRYGGVLEKWRSGLFQLKAFEVQSWRTPWAKSAFGQINRLSLESLKD